MNYTDLELRILRGKTILHDAATNRFTLSWVGSFVGSCLIKISICYSVVFTKKENVL